MQPIIHEVVNAQFLTDGRLFLPFKAEPDVLSLETGAGVEIHRVEPGQRVGAHPVARFRDDPNLPFTDGDHLCQRLECAGHEDFRAFYPRERGILAQRPMDSPDP